MSLGFKLVCDKPGDFSTSQWEEFSDESLRYAFKRGAEPDEEDVMGRCGVMFCKRCPSCRSARAGLSLSDAQCHMARMTDRGVRNVGFVRFGEWSTVACHLCGRTSKFKDWFCEDLKLRPRETVFKDGSKCFAFRRNDYGTEELTVFVSRARQRDGVLIWKKAGGTVSYDARSTLSRYVVYPISETRLAEKILDMPYLEYVKHNEKVRTRNEAARSALAAL